MTSDEVAFDENQQVVMCSIGRNCAEAPVSKAVYAELIEHGLLGQMPKDENGRITSIGSIPHYNDPVGTECRPCLFWFKGQCGRAAQCLFCHFQHPGQKSKRMRASQKTRQRRHRRKVAMAMAAAAAQAAGLNPEDLPTNGRADFSGGMPQHAVYVNMNGSTYRADTISMQKAFQACPTYPTKREADLARQRSLAAVKMTEQNLQHKNQWQKDMNSAQFKYDSSLQV